MTEQDFLEWCRALYQASRYAKTPQMNMTELEQMIQKRVLEAGRMLLASRLEEDPRADPDAEHPCPQCQRELRIQKKARTQRRVLETPLGEIMYRRAYGVCDRCGYSGAPVDRALGIPHTGPSIGTLRKVCHAAVVERSFDGGEKTLKEQAGITFCRQYVRTLAEGEGQRLVKESKKEVALYREHKLRIPSSEKPKLLAITADGGRIQTRQPEKAHRWKEDKIGGVYDAVVQRDLAADTFEKYQGAKAQTKTYVATMEAWEHMGWILRLEAERRGYAKAKQKLFLGDGAKGIREMQQFHFPEAVFILDWPHAAEHLSDSAKAVFGEGTQKARDWYVQLKDMLWEGKRDEIIGDLQKKSRRLGFPKEGEPETSPCTILYRNAYSYFPNNKDAINYPFFRSQGWPIGSGIAEGAVKQFGLRMKGTEKSWNVSDMGAEEMLALCALYHSEDDRWDQYWQRRSQPQPRE